MNSFPPVTPENITIAITVFSRRQYIRRALGSALAQTQPVRVIVVEDCGPDPTLREFVEAEFKGRIEYFRNPRRRGLFGNWNACLEHCRTPWLSILHDDDYLAPNFVASMMQLAARFPGRGLYYGQFTMIDEQGAVAERWTIPPPPVPWRPVALNDIRHSTPFAFAGQLLHAPSATALGGFRATSQFAGDWEMWARLIAHYGGAETRDQVAFTLHHGGADRGSNVVQRGGRQHALMYVQRKRIVALLRRQGEPAVMDRALHQALDPVSLRFLLDHGAGMPPRILGYNLGLLKFSSSLTWRHALGKKIFLALGRCGVRSMSKIWNIGKKHSRKPLKLAA